jgi:RNAse (barnase) inhibitor barstar
MATPDSVASLRASGMVGETRGPITSSDALFSKMAQALEFPDSFGHNWETLDECLRDVPGDVMLLVHDAETLWREAPDVAFQLVELWLEVAGSQEQEMQLVFVWS